MLYDKKRFGMFTIDENGVDRLSDEYLKRQDEAPKCSAAVTAVSGVPDCQASGPMAKLICAFMTGSFRGSLKAIDRIHAAQTLPLDTKMYRETNGDGEEFYRARYSITNAEGRKVSRRLYLGKDKVIADWMCGILEERRWREQSKPHYAEFDMEKIKKLKHLYGIVRKRAQQVVQLTPFTFRGCRLMRRKDK